MSFDTAIAAADASMFAALGQSASIVRGTDPAQTVTVVIEHDQEATGTHGQRVGLATHIHFRKTDWAPQKGDQVTIGASSWRVQRIESDDGYVVKAVLNG